MRIGILTFHDVPNFGAFLQVYALTNVLKNMGHEVEVINLELLKSKKNLFGKIAFWIENSSFKKYRKKYLNETLSYKKLDSQIKFDYDYFIVGSDQVWNKNITKGNALNYFFNFLPPQANKLSYAASFGQKNWNFNQNETEVIMKLIHSFKAISVREDNAVSLCKENLAVDTSIVLDPTLLLKDYSELIKERDEVNNYITCFKFSRDQKFYLFVDKMKDKGYKIRELRGLKPFKNTKLCSFPSVGDWLYYIKSAPFVITDSFHGLCFSIIFKKNFIVIPADLSKFNRIESLLKLLGLEDRIFYSYEDILNNEFLWKKNIDYNIVNEKLDHLRLKSLDFLSKNIL